MGVTDFQITLHRKSNFFEDYGPNYRYRVVVEDESETKQSDSIEKEEYGELKGYLDERDDFKKKDFALIRMLVALGGALTAGIGILFSLTLVLLFAGKPIYASGIMMIRWGMSRKLKYEYTGDEVASVREELQERFQS